LFPTRSPYAQRDIAVGGERLNMYEQPNVTRVQTRRVCLRGTYTAYTGWEVKRLRVYAAWQAAWQSTRQGQISGHLQAIGFDSTSIVVSCRSSVKRHMHEGMRSHGNLGLQVKRRRDIPAAVCNLPMSLTGWHWDGGGPTANQASRLENVD
jgi:hypothetical protein